jgi:hypothetical protein
MSTPSGRPSALRPTLGAIDDVPVEAREPFCDGTVITHVNQIVTCSNPECGAAISGIEAVLDQHSWFVSCTKTLGSECPICR